MQQFISKVKLILADEILRKRIIFLVGALAVFRLLAAIPVPGVNVEALTSYLSTNQFLSLLNLFSGGGLSNLSIVMLGVAPYITASIIMQLMTMIFPKLKEMYQEEGDVGRKRFAQYSRILSVPLGILQAFGILSILRAQGILGSLSTFDYFISLSVIVAGSVLLMWIGELINEYGIGNGTSLIIFAGIIASFPTVISQLYITFTTAQIPLYIAFVLLAVVIIAGVVVVTEAERPVPVTYAKRVRGGKLYGGVSTYLPLRLNQSGVIPIIFALSLLLFPQMITNFLAGSTNQIAIYINTAATFLTQNQIVYGILYFALVFLFTYFYTAVTFDPHQISENLQKNGAFIPGVRPGTPTSEYLGKVVTRLTTFGALFLGIIAILPLIMRGVTGIQALAIGGTGLLIVVSVVLDLVKQLNAQISMREY